MIVNYPAILAAGVIHFAIGMIWYSPFLFGNLWLKLTGVAEMKPNLVDILLALGSSLIVAFVMAYMVLLSGAVTMIDGAIVGIIIEVGFIATLLLGDMIFEKKPFKLFLLRNGYNLVALAVIGAILAVWR